MKRYLGAGFVLFSSLFFLYQNCSPVRVENIVENSKSDLSSLVPVCQEVASEGVAPKLKWDWIQELPKAPTDQQYLSFSQVMASPAVADLNNDKIPEVVFVTWSNQTADHFEDIPSGVATYSRNGVLRIVEGPTGRTLKSIASQELAPFATQTPLLMDIDGDGRTEIFYYHYTRKDIIALNFDGQLRWRFSIPDSQGLMATGITGADTNGDGIGEVVAANLLISEDSSHAPYQVRKLGAVAVQRTALALPLDPQKPTVWSIVNSNGIFNSSGQSIRDFASSAFTAAGDLYPEIPGLEVVSVGNNSLQIYNGLTGELIRSTDLLQYNDLRCSNGAVGGGPPSIGDFDGDPSRLEIAVATGRYLTVFDREGQMKYQSQTQDCSSLTTGLTTFDLNGDRKPEILYADEEYFRIYEVKDGQLRAIHELVNPSGTLHEYPVVADLTGKGTSQILVASNNYAVGNFYKDPSEARDREAALKVTGVRAFESSGSQAWMPTRPVWNQYSFHPDLVDDHGRFLRAPVVNGSMFRRNNQGQKDLNCRKL